VGDLSRVQTTSLHTGENVKLKVKFTLRMISYFLIETISRKKTYAQIFMVDAFYKLIICKACNIGLPHEWAKGHCVKHKVTVALLWKVIDLGK
jgi:hypothetical protein